MSKNSNRRTVGTFIVPAADSNDAATVDAVVVASDAPSDVAGVPDTAEELAALDAEFAGESALTGETAEGWQSADDAVVAPIVTVPAIPEMFRLRVAGAFTGATLASVKQDYDAAIAPIGLVAVPAGKLNDGKEYSFLYFPAVLLDLHQAREQAVDYANKTRSLVEIVNLLSSEWLVNVHPERATGTRVPRATSRDVTNPRAQGVEHKDEEVRDWSAWRINRDTLTAGNASWIKWEDRILKAVEHDNLDALLAMDFAGALASHTNGNSYGKRMGNMLRAQIAKLESKREAQAAEREAAKEVASSWLDAMAEAAD